jgi:uncharacterized membrane protein YagU involved in acid resistance
MMSAESTAISLEQTNSYRAIPWSGLIAGTLDITAAFVNSGLRGRSPMWVLQSIASGLLGADAFKGGWRTAGIGAVLHFFIAFVAGAVYFAASRRLEFLVNQPIVSGLLYGVAVYLFMYAVVLPLTFHRSFLNPITAVVTGLAIHMVCVGLPISLIVRRYS